MGMSVYAHLYYGYVMPEVEYDEEWDEDNEDLDDESLWFRALGPQEIKDLDLTKEETDAWNAIPYTAQGRREDLPEYKAFSDKYGIYLDAKSEWLKKNPLPASQEPIGSYESDDKFLALHGPDGEKLGTYTYWDALPVDLNDPMFQVDQAEAKKTLDAYLTTIGITPPEALPQWHLVPLYG